MVGSVIRKNRRTWNEDTTPGELQVVQQAPPINLLLGLSKASESRSAWPHKSLGNVWRKDERMTEDDDNENDRQGDAGSDNLISYDELRL